MQSIIDRLKEFRKLEPVRFDSYIKRGVMALAATIGIILDAETAGFVVGVIVFLLWGSEGARKRVTPVDENGEPLKKSKPDEGDSGEA